jgi:hypothetical protein
MKTTSEKYILYHLIAYSLSYNVVSCLLVAMRWLWSCYNRICVRQQEVRRQENPETFA